MEVVNHGKQTWQQGKGLVVQGILFVTRNYKNTPNITQPNHQPPRLHTNAPLRHALQPFARFATVSAPSDGPSAGMASDLIQPPDAAAGPKSAQQGGHAQTNLK